MPRGEGIKTRVSTIFFFQSVPRHAQKIIGQRCSHILAVRVLRGILTTSSFEADGVYAVPSSAIVCDQHFSPARLSLPTPLFYLCTSCISSEYNLVPTILIYGVHQDTALQSSSIQIVLAATE